VTPKRQTSGTTLFSRIYSIIGVLAIRSRPFSVLHLPASYLSLALKQDVVVMANKGREAKTHNGQVNIYEDLEEGDVLCFKRDSGDDVCKAHVVEVATDTREYYGQHFPEYVYLEGPRGGKYVAVVGGLNANEENVQLYNTPGGHMPNPNPRREGANLLSFDVLEVVG
jgi:hypothetical protein